MALWLTRGAVLARIRARAPTLSGLSRSLSSATLDQINTKDLNQISSPSRSLSANPIEKSDDEIKSLVSYVNARIDEYIKSGRRRPLPLVFGCELYLNTDSVFKTYPENIRFMIMLRVADVLQNIPQVDKIQIYHAKRYYRSMLTEESTLYITKHDVTKRVLSVIRRFPKVGKFKVTKETHFCKDLDFGMWDIIDVNQALQVEFKLYIPCEIVSCKHAIQYIYDHRMERLHLDEFRKQIFITGEFGDSKSEFRRIFVPCEEKRANGIKSNLDCRALSFNGFSPYKYFKDKKLRFSCLFA